MKRIATAFWKGTINEGEGYLTTQRDRKSVV